jgi:hypothetical protein
MSHSRGTAQFLLEVSRRGPAFGRGTALVRPGGPSIHRVGDPSHPWYGGDCDVYRAGSRFACGRLEISELVLKDAEGGVRALLLTSLETMSAETDAFDPDRHKG